MVVDSVGVLPTLWRNATRVPLGTRPLSATGFWPPAGFSPMCAGSFAVQPVMTVPAGCWRIDPGALANVFASKLGFGNAAAVRAAEDNAAAATVRSAKRRKEEEEAVARTE